MGRNTVVSLLSLILFGLFVLMGCGKDSMNPVSGDFDIESGSPLTQEELNNALDLNKATTGLTTAAEQGNAEAGFALQGMSFAQQAFSTLMNVVNKGNLLDKMTGLSKPSDEIRIDLGNGIDIIIKSTDVTQPTEGIETTWVLDGTCTSNSNISFNNSEILTGFISSNYRNGKFRYDHGNLFAAVFCGAQVDGEISGEYVIEWAISQDGTVKIFVDLDVNFSGQGTTVDYSYVATFVINPNGSGSARGKIKGSITANGTTQNFDNSFNVSWS